MSNFVYMQPTHKKTSGIRAVVKKIPVNPVRIQAHNVAFGVINLQKQTLRYEYMITRSLIFGIVMCILAYGYFLNNTILYVSERKSYESKISELTTELGVKEGVLLSEQLDISLEKAKQYGFKEADRTHFITVDNATKLSYNDPF